MSISVIPVYCSRSKKKQNLRVKNNLRLNVKIKGNEKYEFYSIQLQCHSTSRSTQPNPTHHMCWKMRPNPTQPMDRPNPCLSLPVHTPVCQSRWTFSHSGSPGAAPTGPACEGRYTCSVSIDLDPSRCCRIIRQTWNWVIGSSFTSGSPGHWVIILTRCETRVFPVFEKMPKTQNVHLKC